MQVGTIQRHPIWAPWPLPKPPVKAAFTSQGGLRGEELESWTFFQPPFLSCVPLGLCFPSCQAQGIWRGQGKAESHSSPFPALGVQESDLRPEGGETRGVIGFGGRWTAVRGAETVPVLRSWPGGLGRPSAPQLTHPSHGHITSHTHHAHTSHPLPTDAHTPPLSPTHTSDPPCRHTPQSTRPPPAAVTCS